MKPIPKWHERKQRWYLDLRPEYGQHWAPVAIQGPPVGFESAFSWAWEVFERCRIAHRMRQPELPGIDGSRRLSSIVDAYAEIKRCEKTGGREWWDKYAKWVKAEIGSQSIREFEPPAGNVVLKSYRDACRARGLAAKTTENRLCVLFQVLRHAASQGYLAALPVKPAACHEGERIYVPQFLYVDEPTFRRLRDSIYSNDGAARKCEMMVRRQMAKTGRPPFPHFTTIADLIERRRFMLSCGFYCGYHTADLMQLPAEWFAPDARLYRVHNEKNSRHVRDTHVEMPAPFLEDCRAELKRLGRPWHPGELVGGGPWDSYDDVLRRASNRMGLGFWVNARILRRSFVRELVMRGYSKSEVITLMGHTADSRMVDQVYSETPVGLNVRTKWTGPVAPPRRGAVSSMDTHRRKARGGGGSKAT